MDLAVGSKGLRPYAPGGRYPRLRSFRGDRQVWRERLDVDERADAPDTPADADTGPDVDARAADRRR